MKIRATLVAAALFCAFPANAAVIVEEIAFSATATGPLPLHNGVFTIQYDNVTNIASLLDIDFSIGSTVFSTANAGLAYAGNDVLLGRSYFLGGTQTGVNGLSSNTNDFIFHFSPYTLTARAFSYSTVGFNSIASGNVALSEAGAVPEPATWATMLLGFGLIGGAMRSALRRPKLAVAPA
ncbi:PEPxxWA-CTERM sorting domain-containing protein [Sphingopyxis sp.]|uniref:PEPxxWA-CTERM sorting domain-containing protein n=1 Tax=Sphingopyxis sp. TaxID=1908224 RepID=UPI00257E3138|nr:PEPxxWA-CTERM sorting domain-containing protein [Sphingopyxis sp.]